MGGARRVPHFCNYSWGSQLLSACGPAFDRLISLIDLPLIEILGDYCTSTVGYRSLALC